MEYLLGTYVRKIKSFVNNYYNNNTTKFISTSIIVGSIASGEAIISQPLEKIRIFYQAKH